MSNLNNDGHPDAILQYIDGTIGVWYLDGTAGNQIQGFALIAAAPDVVGGGRRGHGC